MLKLGSWMIINVPFLVGDVDNGVEAVHVWGWVYGMSVFSVSVLMLI